MSARDNVLSYRDGFLELVKAYNEVGAYEHAQNAQAMAIACHKFEESHNLTMMAWPPRIATGKDGTKHLKDIDGNEIYTGDL